MFKFEYNFQANKKIKYAHILFIQELLNQLNATTVIMRPPIPAFEAEILDFHGNNCRCSDIENVFFSNS